MTAYLQVKSLYQYMRPKFVEPVFTAAQQVLIDNVDMDETPLAPGVQDALDAQTAFATWQLLDDQVLGAINLQLSESIAEIYDNIDNAQALWHVLLQRYSTTGRTRTYYEYQSIMDWKLDERKDPEESLNAIVTCFERLAGQGFTLPEEQKAMTLLRGVPRNWDSFVGSVLANVGPSGLRVQHVSIQIREEWWRCHPPSMVHTTNTNMARGDLQNRIGEQAPTWHGRGGGSGRGRGHGRGWGHGRGYTPYQPQQQQQNSGAGNAPRVEQNQQWNGQMQGQMCGPNWQRNKNFRQQAKANKAAARAANSGQQAVHYAAATTMSLGGHTIMPFRPEFQEGSSNIPAPAYEEPGYQNMEDDGDLQTSGICPYNPRKMMGMILTQMITMPITMTVNSLTRTWKTFVRTWLTLNQWTYVRMISIL